MWNFTRQALLSIAAALAVVGAYLWIHRPVARTPAPVPDHAADVVRVYDVRDIMQAKDAFAAAYAGATGGDVAQAGCGHAAIVDGPWPSFSAINEQIAGGWIPAQPCRNPHCVHSMLSSGEFAGGWLIVRGPAAAHQRIQGDLQLLRALR